MDQGVLQKSAEILAPSLKRLEKQVSNKKHAAIRDAVAAVSDGLPGSLFQGNLVEALAKALVTALETRDKKVVEPSIEVTQKLITSGMIRGEVTRLHAPNLQDAEKEKKKKKKKGQEDPVLAELGLDAVLLGAVCSCFDIGDDGVEQQVVKCIMAAAMSGLLVVHGEALMTAVRACYNIHLGSRNDQNQCLAKAALVQIVDTYLQRVELDTAMTHVRPVNVVDVMGGPAMVAQQGKSTINTVKKVQEMITGVVGDMSPMLMMFGGVQFAQEALQVQPEEGSSEGGAGSASMTPRPLSPPGSPSGPSPKGPADGDVWSTPADADPFADPAADPFATPSKLPPAAFGALADDPFTSPAPATGGFDEFEEFASPAPALPATPAVAMGGFDDDAADPFGTFSAAAPSPGPAPAAFSDAADAFDSFAAPPAAPSEAALEDDPFGAFAGAAPGAAEPESAALPLDTFEGAATAAEIDEEEEEEGVNPFAGEEEEEEKEKGIPYDFQEAADETPLEEVAAPLAEQEAEPQGADEEETEPAPAAAAAQDPEEAEVESPYIPPSPLGFRAPIILSEELTPVPLEEEEEEAAAVEAPEPVPMPDLGQVEPEAESEAVTAAEQVTLDLAAEQASNQQAAAAFQESMNRELSRNSSVAPDPAASAAEQQEEADEDALSEYGRDAYMLFRALIKLSLKPAELPNGHVDPIAARGKCLSLELIKAFLDRAGPTVLHSGAFTSAIRQQLCMSLLKNLPTTVPEALRLTCSVFLALLIKYRALLKAEMGVFFPMFVLKVLETASCVPGAKDQQGITMTFNTLALVLRVVKGMTEHGQLLLDVFVNYDCDIQGAALYERTVKALVKLALGAHFKDPNAGSLSAPQVAYVRVEALSCVVRLILSHWEWLQARMPHKDGTAVAPAPSAREPAEELPVEGAGQPAAAAAQPGSPKDNSRAGSPGPLREASITSDGAAPSLLPATPSSSNLAAALAAALPSSSFSKPVVSVSDLRNAKQVFAQGIDLFNKKPKKGIAFLQDKGLVGASTEDVARFLFDTKTLDKTALGEYLGEGESFPIQAMHQYIDLFDFAGVEFDEAIRRLLSAFRLPGEAQKIDRIIEKFSERYFKNNPGSFRSASAAYTLGFSIIMLNTDAHNKMVKNKMSRDDFVRNNRGMNDGVDFPTAYLGAVYDRITTNEIKMRDDDAPTHLQSSSLGFLGNPANLFLETMLGLLGRKGQTQETVDGRVQKVTEHLREIAQSTAFHAISEPDAVRPLLEVVWLPVVEALLALYEEHENPKIVELCCKGLKAAACLVCALGMERHRRFLVHVLSRYALIHYPTNMRHKSLHAIRALLGIAESQGNNLVESWAEVLRFVSRLEAVHAIGVQGAPLDAILFGGRPMEETKKGLFGKKVVMIAPPLPPPRKPEPGDPYRNLGAVEFAHEGRVLQLPLVSELASADAAAVSLPGPPLNNMELVLNPKEIDGMAREVLKNVDIQSLQRIFQRTQFLDSDAIVEFVKGLCAVAMEELSSQSALRVYSMAKIVEVSLYNTQRIRLVWARIWSVLGDFFCRVGCHPNTQVAMYAVDSLRQLSSRSLEREELNNFSFQNDFMRPFVSIMKHSPSTEIREMIIRSVSQMVLAKVANVKSGWKTVLQLFTVAAQDPSQQIVQLAFETIEKIVRQHFTHIVETEAVTFTDLVNALLAYTSTQGNVDVPLNAIAFLRYCAIMLAEGKLGAAVDADTLPPARADGAEDAAEGGVDSRRPLPGASPVPPEDSTALLDVGSGAHPPGPGDGLVTAGTTFFTDKAGHMYFWIPLLAGLSELSYDPRVDIRRAALGVLFDILKYHGPNFSTSFWNKVFDTVLFPIFDEVRAGVAPPPRDEDEDDAPGSAREEAGRPSTDGHGNGPLVGPAALAAPPARLHSPQSDQWLFETCSICLNAFVEVFAQFFPRVSSQLPTFLGMLSGFLLRSHEPLAALCLDSCVRVVVTAGRMFSEDDWDVSLALFANASESLWPDVRKLGLNGSKERRKLGAAAVHKLRDVMGKGLEMGSNLLGHLRSPDRAPVSPTHSTRGDMGINSPPPGSKDGAATSAAAAPAPAPAPESKKSGGFFSRAKKEEVAPVKPAPLEHVDSASASQAGEGEPLTPGSPTDVHLARGPSAVDDASEPVHPPMSNEEWARLLVKCRARSVLLVRAVQGLMEVYVKLAEHVSPRSMTAMLAVLESIKIRAAVANGDEAIRRGLQHGYQDRRPDKKDLLSDPPLLKLEIEATSGHVSLLVFVTARKDELAARIREECRVEERLVAATAAYLERFEGMFRPKAHGAPGPDAEAAAAHQRTLFSVEESRAHAGMVVAVLNAIGFFPVETFQKHVVTFYPLLVRLVACPGADWETRKALAQLLDSHVGALVLPGGEERVRAFPPAAPVVPTPPGRTLTEEPEAAGPDGVIESEATGLEDVVPVPASASEVHVQAAEGAGPALANGLALGDSGVEAPEAQQPEEQDVHA